MIQIKVSEPWPSTKSKPMYQATLSEWDLGVPIGDGSTIQDAIDSFLDAYWDIWVGWNPDSSEINYKWS